MLGKHEFERLRSAAVFGDQARALLDRIAKGMREGVVSGWDPDPAPRH